MPRSDNVECYISTPNGRLEEYQDPDQDEITLGSATSVTRYIESKAGETFSVTILASDGAGLVGTGTTHLAFRFSMDGVRVDGTFTACNVLNGFPASVTLRGPDSINKDGQTEGRDFMFTEIDLTEDKPDDGIDKDKASMIGELRVFVFRFVDAGYLTRCTTTMSADGLPGRKVHEKELKGRDIAHSARLSNPRPINFTCMSGTWLDPLDRPFKAFRFLYRSHHALQSLGLIPRSPSPESVLVIDEVRPVEEMSPEELRAELLRMRNGGLGGRPQNDRKRRHPSSAVIKSEGGASGRKKPKVIDLTDD